MIRDYFVGYFKLIFCRQRDWRAQKKAWAELGISQVELTTHLAKGGMVREVGEGRGGEGRIVAH